MSAQGYGGCVYILTTRKHTVLYTGSTSDLRARIYQHRNRTYPGSFTGRYNVDKLIYYETFSRIEEAIEREKYIKGKGRRWKEELISQSNPDWKDLSDEIDDW